MPLWPDTPPGSEPMPGPENVKTSTDLIGGKTVVSIRNVSTPTMTLYQPPAGKETGAAVVVFPGGGFEMLAMDLEGTDVCDWLTPRGVACVLLKYRVPGEPYRWKCNCRPHNTALSMPSLQDAQRTIRLVRFHAARVAHRSAQDRRDRVFRGRLSGRGSQHELPSQNVRAGRRCGQGKQPAGFRDADLSRPSRHAESHVESEYPRSLPKRRRHSSCRPKTTTSIRSRIRCFISTR